MTAISLFDIFELAGRLFKYISWTVYNMNYFLPLKSHGFKISGKFITMKCHIPQTSHQKNNF